VLAGDSVVLLSHLFDLFAELLHVLLLRLDLLLHGRVHSLRDGRIHQALLRGQVTALLRLLNVVKHAIALSKHLLYLLVVFDTAKVVKLVVLLLNFFLEDLDVSNQVLVYLHDIHAIALMLSLLPLQFVMECVH